MLIIVIFLLAYVIGSIPTGYLLTRYNGIADIRTLGSGNIGATNVGRFLGVWGFVFVLLIDVLKSMTVLYVLQQYGYGNWYQYSAIAGLLLGNGYSLFINFTGGKGVATVIGILLMLHPLIIVYGFFIWALLIVLFRQVGMASVCSALFLPCIGYFITNEFSIFLISFFMALWIIYRHKQNILTFYTLISR